MSATIIYERFLWFHSRVKEGRFPNATSLARHFEIVPKTAQRNIVFMRDRLCAPLEYDPAHRGYCYEDDTYELPGLWIREEELVSLLVSARLAAAVPDDGMKASLRNFLNSLLRLHSVSNDISLEAIGPKVSVKNIEYCRTDERIFHRILDALLRARPLQIAYYSPHNDEATTRDILPLHLLHYMGTWHIIAHCAMKDGLRDFVLSRIKSVVPSPRALAARETAPSIKEFIRKNFGIMTGGDACDVCLRFSAHVSPWLAEQVWHPAQQMRWEDGKTLCLTFPVADFREVKREILKYGAEVEVVAPEGLREEVKIEIEKMRGNYEKKR
ncbi:MAG: WYL domain-containing protein [Syntrophales bacterium]|nr:WYL domain-containing protein [Syntrophales bacterium]